MSLTQFAEIQIPIELRAMIKQKKGNKSYHAYLRELIEKSEGQHSTKSKGLISH